MNKQNIYQYRILILDFGSQYTQLVARRIRNLGVYCKLWSYEVTEQKIREFSPHGIILSGGPESTTQYYSPRAPDYVFYAGIPVLGICYGMQTMAIQLGGKVESTTKREFGYAQVKLYNTKRCLLIKDIQDAIDDLGNPLLDVWMSHGDILTTLPKDFLTIGSTDTCPLSIIANEKKCFYGVQFHPEVTHTPQGTRILERFVLDICHCKALWRPKSIIDDLVKRLHYKIGKDKVILGLSGGVDSAVTAMLLHRAIGKRLTCFFINNGLLRLNEEKQVMEMFSDFFGLNIIKVEGEQRFLNALYNKDDPEEKRKIIGRLFIEIFDEEARKLKDIKWLAQGTIYSDVIESSVASKGKSKIIKSHHNVGGLPQKMQLKLIEPLRELFKDEVRQIGLDLGLPYKVLFRHPFPGPGLGVRILGKIKKEYCNLLRKADAIFIEELNKANLYTKVSQAFTVFLPVRSVGVMGDNRKYDWVIALRAVETSDFMTAKWAHLPYDLLGCVANRIINEIDGISRVVYDISSKPPATIEWE